MQETVPQQRLHREICRRRAADQVIAEQAAQLDELQRRLAAAVAGIAHRDALLAGLREELAAARRGFNHAQHGSLRASRLGTPA